MLGKLLFSQCAEIPNHQTNTGLPPNLTTANPSVPFCYQGLDISIAAYQSELSSLPNPISNHVRLTEMHNQAGNSLAFLSTRFTIQVVDRIT